MKTIYLFRHGQTDWNKIEKLQGRENIPLNNTGIEQAKEIAELLKSEGLEHIYSSPLDRAYKTGEIVAEASNIEIEKVDDLIEVSFGDYSGKTKSEVRKILGDEKYESFIRFKGCDDLSFPNGEKKIDAINRFINCVFDIAENTEYSKFGIAAHGFVIKMFLLYQNFEVEKMKNCAIVKAIYSDRKIENIEFLN